MSTAGGARVTLVSQWLRLVLQLGGFVVLSRLLVPSDFGLIAMVAVIVALASTFADFGLGLAGVQATSLAQAQKSTLFLINSAAGFLGSLLVLLVTPVVAAFYNEPLLLTVTPVLAVPLLLTSLGVQFRVEMNRAGRFGAMALQEVVSAAAGLSVAVLAAVYGLGYWALVLQSTTLSFVLLVLSVWQSRWFPTKPAPLSQVRSFIMFGSHTFVLQIANLVSSTTDVASIGRMQSANELGLYTRSTQVMSMLFAQLAAPLTRVLLPRLSRVAGTEGFHSDLLKVEKLTTYALLGAVSFAACIGPPAIPVVFGSAWIGMAPVLQILCVGAACQSVGYVFYWACLALSKTRLLLWAELPGRVVMISGAIAFAPVGIEAVASMMALGQIVILIGSSAVVRAAGVQTGRILLTALVPGIMYGCAFAITWLFGMAMGWSGLFAIIGNLICWCVVVGVGLSFGRVRLDVRECISLALRKS